MVFGFGAAEIVVVGQHAELGKVIVDKGKPFPIVAAERLVYDCIDKLSGEPLDKRPELSPEIASAVKFPDKLISSLLSGILCLIVIVRLQALNQLVDNSPVKLVALPLNLVNDKIFCRLADPVADISPEQCVNALDIVVAFISRI